jgi:hypothetical protein
MGIMIRNLSGTVPVAGKKHKYGGNWGHRTLVRNQAVIQHATDLFRD